MSSPFITLHPVGRFAASATLVVELISQLPPILSSQSVSPLIQRRFLSVLVGGAAAGWFLFGLMTEHRPSCYRVHAANNSQIL